jgi:hypothetical protein
MIRRALLSSLSELPQPVLTAYLDTNPGERDNQRTTPAYMAWIKTEARSIAPDVPPSERLWFAKT